MATITKSQFGAQRHRSTVRKAKQRKAAYRKSFGDFPDRTIYRDPLGHKTRGENVAFQKEWNAQLHAEVDWPDHVPGSGHCSIVQKWNELQRKGFDVASTTDMIQKSLDTGDWQLPLDILDDVFVVNPGHTPMAEFIPRVTTQDDTIHATPQTDQPEPEFGLEETASTNAEGDRVYEFDTGDYEDLEYDVLGYGVATRISDQMILSSANLRPAESTTEEALITGHRKKTDRQIIWGQEEGGSADGDSDGWRGFTDMGETFDTLDQSGEADDPDTLKETAEDAIDTVEDNGAEKGNIAVVTDFESHRTMQRAFDDLVRYEAQEDLVTGFSTFAMDGGEVPVFKSNSVPRVSNYEDETTDFMWIVNMESVALYQLAEPQLRPLAKLGPQERVAADQYNVLVSESGDGDELDASHIQRIQVDAPA